ncbi:hypothetical protein DFQ28_002549 [Apophysomyces sp. BC1034]|nr:hypothetical protein DFQ30_006815 [Apophysomyces sp. BC1015]KAG0179116.1 hypothetical protein DFQ29_002506 [Apophysomyces sp. BC1021]KAG0193901.1 hypothetical protein DFQ28_002549 [Apophysomyces sp. BC1034]
MAGSFVIVGNPGKKISLERASHPCPRCKHLSVQLTRSEKQLIVLNKRIANNMSVRYECSNCKWKNEELPDDDTDLRSYRSDQSDNYYLSSPTSPTMPEKTF